MSEETTMVEDTVIDVEEIEDRPAPPSDIVEASTARRMPATPSVGLFGTSDPVEVIAHARRAAKALMEVVEENKLFLEKPDGKRYLNVEAWTLLASMLQVRAIPEDVTKEPDADGEWRPPKMRVETKRLHSKYCKKGKAGHKQHAECETYEKEIPVLDAPGHGGYKAKVVAYDPAGNIIGKAFSQCMWEEWRWRDSDAYAIESMAQTRGISKALSGPLRFIVELAGFKGTPAEEVDTGREWNDTAVRDVAPERDDPYLRRADGDLIPCPSCGNRVYDNTNDNEKMEKRWPAYKCSNKSCNGGEDGQPWATWDRGFFDSPATKAKKGILRTVDKHQAGWRIYYDPTDPAFDEAMVDKINTAIAEVEGDDETRPKQMAGIIYTELIETRGLFEAEMTDAQAAGLIRAVEMVLSRAEADATDIITLDEAYESAEDLIDAEADADPSVGY